MVTQSLIVFSHLAPKHTRLTERTWQMKVEHIRTQMTDNPYKPTAVLLSALDETACKNVKPGNSTFILIHLTFHYLKSSLKSSYLLCFRAV